MAIKTPKALVFNGLDDWYDWLNYIKDLATARRVWSHADPAVEAIPALVEPSIPTIQDVKPDAAADANIMTLSE